MNQAPIIEIPVEEVTATALSDARRREAVGRLRSAGSRTAAEAPKAGLTEAEVEAELAAHYNTERRA
jgi:hypothetical protein